MPSITNIEREKDLDLNAHPASEFEMIYTKENNELRMLNNIVNETINDPKLIKNIYIDETTPLLLNDSLISKQVSELSFDSEYDIINSTSVDL